MRGGEQARLGAPMRAGSPCIQARRCSPLAAAPWPA